MQRRRWRVWAAAGLAALGVPTGAARAIASCAPPPRADEVLVVRPLQEAMREADAQGRVLVVEIAGNADRRKQALVRWSSPVVRAWAVRHAVPVLLTDAATIRQLTEGDLNPGPDADPLVFRGGKQVRVFGSGLPQKKSRLKGPGKPGEAFVGLALKLDWTQRGKDDAQPAALEAGAPKALYGEATEEAAAVTDLPAGDLGGLIARYGRARALAQSKDADSLREATGLCTWLWERGAQTDARFVPARSLLLAPLMESLGTAHPVAPARWKAMRRALLDALDVRDHASMFDLLILSRVIGDHEENLAFIDDALNDSDAALMMPTLERAAWELMLPACHWLPAGPVDPEARFASLDKRFGRARRLVPEGARAALDALWARLRTLELARTYVTCLARSQDEQAAAVIGLCPQDQRAALVVSALCAGEAREAHLAIAGGDDGLVKAVQDGLAARAAAEPSPK